MIYWVSRAGFANTYINRARHLFQSIGICRYVQKPDFQMTSSIHASYIILITRAELSRPARPVSDWLVDCPEYGLSQSLIKSETVLVSFEGVNLVNSGQGRAPLPPLMLLLLSLWPSVFRLGEVFCCETGDSHASQSSSTSISISRPSCCCCCCCCCCFFGSWRLGGGGPSFPGVSTPNSFQKDWSVVFTVRS